MRNKINKIKLDLKKKKRKNKSYCPDMQVGRVFVCVDQRDGGEKKEKSLFDE